MKEGAEGDTVGGDGEVHNEQEKSIINYKICRSMSEIKHKLMGKYSGYISSLKQDFCKKNNKGKLPREATQILLNWWTTHYNWPYPTVCNQPFHLKYIPIWYSISLLEFD